ncbi:MAG: hypothetical protein VW080_10320 [Flavobacteriaceae bacterium]
METSVLISKILSIIYLSFFTGVLLSRSYYRDVLSKWVDDPTGRILGGTMAILLGCIIIEIHNYWGVQWTVAVTLFGWLSLFKGIALIVFPQAFNTYKITILKAENLRYFLVLALILGLFFGYFGFFY